MSNKTMPINKSAKYLFQQLFMYRYNNYIDKVNSDKYKIYFFNVLAAYHILSLYI